MIIDFNKYSMGGGGSGGGSGSDPEAVKYTEQSLTDEQKAQARTNIGAAAPEIFWATYGTTTAEEIAEASQAGKQPLVNDNGIIHTYGGTDGSYHYFFAIISNISYRRLMVQVSTGNWSRHNLGVERTSDKVSTVVENESDTNKYPNTKAVADYVGLLSNLSTTDKSNIVAALNEVANLRSLIPVDTAIPSGGLDANVHYELGTLTGSVSITLDTTTEVSGQMNIYSLSFTAGSTAPTINWPSSITNWAGNCLDSTTMAPVITGGNSYEVSIRGGLAVITEFVA